MENQLGLDFDGQAVYKSDIDTLGEVAGLADDRVLAELFRMAPNGAGVARGILPYKHSGSSQTPLIAPNGASGSVLVHPFRAMIGSRTAVGTEARENWRDIRSGLSVAAGSTALPVTVSIAANASGSGRIDTVYATVVVEADSAPVTRNVKNPGSGAVTAETVSVFQSTVVTVGVVTGTPSAPPLAAPALPADAGGTYYILLGYIFVPNGSGAGTTYDDSRIGVVATCLSMSEAMGVSSIEPVNQQSSYARFSNGGGPSASFLPSTLRGGKGLFFAIRPGNSAPEFATTEVIDDRDWRGRLCKWTACVVSTSTAFVWNSPATTAASFPGDAGKLGFADTTSRVTHGFGNTIMDGITSTTRDVVVVDGALLADMDNASVLRVYCDHADGNLRVAWTGTPGVNVFIWMEFTGSLDNFL